MTEHHEVRLKYFNKDRQWDDLVEEIKEAHGDNIEFRTKTNWRNMIKIKRIKTRPGDQPTERETVFKYKSKPSVKEVISAIGKVTGKINRKSELEKVEEENKQLRQKNESLREQLSEMEEKLEQMDQALGEMSAEDRDERGTDERIDEVFEDAGLDDPEL